MKFLLLFSLIDFFLPTFSNAQYHFTQSTIWLNSDDSLKGWIDENGLFDHPDRIRFKWNAADDDGVFYTAAQVSKFKLESRLERIGFVGLIDSAHFFLVPHDTAIEAVTILDTLFLKPLITGRANLFSAIDHRGIRHYFIEKKFLPAEELHYYNIQWAKKGTNVGNVQKMIYYHIERNGFRQQMLIAFSDNPQLYIRLAKGHPHFNGTSLKKWFRRYNDSFVES